MVFSSSEFMFAFFPLTLLFYYAVPKRYIRMRNLVLLAFSLIFYGWGEPKYVLLMVLTILADYAFGYLIERCGENRKKAKRWLVAAVIVNLAILGFFKYATFLLSNLALIPGLSGIPVPNIKLPVGISFYTFQALSYVIDVYRGDTRAQHDPLAFGTYVTLFPQLVAGPIVRYRDIDDMLIERTESRGMIAEGVRTFIAGLAKKVILANVAGAVWENFRAIPAADQTVLGSWLGLIFYTFQIYFDFSAYSDMAIGLGKMFGFTFLENFNYPYISKSVTEFWRRWHISLSTWFREYVYFPLGGSRCEEKWKNYRNIFVVWLCTGIWHGASWNYVLWGLYYFVLLMLEKTVLKPVLEKLPSAIRHITTMIAVMFGWWLFVFEDLGAGVDYLGSMFGMGAGFTSQAVNFDLGQNLIFLAVLAVAATPAPRNLFWKLYNRSSACRAVAVGGSAVMLVIALTYLVSSSYNPFLYYIF